MKSLENYLDLCTELEMIGLDLERVDADMNYWFGKGDIMLGSEGSRNFGSKEAIERIEHLHHKKHGILKRQEHYQEMKADYENALSKMNDLESQIAYMRTVKKMTLKEIALKLQYSESHIRKISQRVNKIIHTPLTQDVVIFK